jgi:MFS family permease
MVRIVLAFTLVIVAGSLVFQSTTVSLPKLFQERMAGLVGSTSGVGFLAAAIFTVGAMTQLVVGRLVDRFSLKAIFLAVSGLSAPCLLLAAFASDWAMLVAAGGIMAAIFGQVTINDTMLARYTADEWRSRIYALRYFLGFVTAGAAVPMVSILHDGFGGFATVYTALSAMGAVVFLGALLFPRDAHQPAARLAAAE